MKISMQLNGELRDVEVDPRDILLDVLREKLGIKSPKIGCEKGDCGACTILMNGKTVRSCLILAVEADGQEIVTVEGIGRQGMTPLQKAFVQHNSFQCGFCAPGMTLSATELLSRIPHPTHEQIREALAGNLCRCTGYTPIVDAVYEASRKNGKRTTGKRKI
ncbi:MAG TPA: (2Fe-2S)-binding protein [Verrucomicrobia bacterium]|nr:(2Fe-2S)-binding protein [Verrucomicrobiota bacterium]